MNPLRNTVTLCVLALAFAVQLHTAAADPPQKAGYSARLLSPVSGDVLTPGQHVKIAWDANFPKVDLSSCETEIYLSLDGGRTFTQVTGERQANTQSFDWIVPNMPSENAVLNIRFGCLGHYPETDSVQTQAAFVIRGK